MPISGILAKELGWEFIFYFFGTFGVIWFGFWIYLCYDSPATHPKIQKVEYFSII